MILNVYATLLGGKKDIFTISAFNSKQRDMILLEMIKDSKYESIYYANVRKNGTEGAMKKVL